MHGNIRERSTTTIEIGVRLEGKSVREGFADKSADTSGWFAAICKRLLPREKPGQALVCDTGFDERDCRRYAAGDVRPSGWFVVQLLRSDNGWTWLCAVMDVAQPRWWVELQRARRIADAMREIDRA